VNLYDLDRMEHLQSAADVSDQFEGFDATMGRLTKVHELWMLLSRALPCTAKQEKFLMMMVVANLVRSAALMLRKSAQEYADNEAITDKSNDIPW
jgi:hypothetical protein